MAKSLGSSKKPTRRPKSKPGCSACKQRRLKCDKTLPICQRCESSGRVCNGLWEKTSMTPQTLASINTSSATCEEDCTSAEPGASTAIEALGLGEVHTEDYILVEAFEGQKENNIQNPRSKGRPSGDGGDCRRSTFMVVVDHSEPSANTPEETVSEDEFTEGANQQGFENILTGKRTADTAPLSDTMPNAKRARRNREEQNGEDLTIVSTGTIGEHIQTTKEDKRLNSASVSNASEAPLRQDRIVSQTSRQISSEEFDAVQTAKMALLAVGRCEPSQDNMPSDSRIEPNCASVYSCLTDWESRARTKEGSPCTDQQPSATELPTAGANESHNAKSPSQSKNHPSDVQSPPSISLSYNCQEPSNPNVPTHDRQSLIDSSELEQDPRRSRNSQVADSSSQNTSRAERVHRLSEPQTLGTSSTARNGQSPMVGSSFRSTTQNPDCPDLLRGSPHTPNQTSMQDKHAGSQPFQLQRVSSADTARGSHPSNHRNSNHYLESLDDPALSRIMYTSSSSAVIPTTHLKDSHQAPSYEKSSCPRNELGPGNASRDSRGQVDSFNHNQRHLSASNFHAPSSGRSLQSAFQPPAVTFTLDNHIQSALPMATVESLVEIFSRNCKVVLRSKTTSPGDAVYPVDVIIWQHSPDFYKWYVSETRTAKVSTLIFELSDADRKLEKAFSTPMGNPYYFQMLKQCIWDSFWVASELNHAPAHFSILIRPAPHLDNRTLPRSPVAVKQNAMNATTSALPAVRFATSTLGNVGIVAHSRSPVVTIPQTYDGCPPHNTEATTRQTPTPFVAPLLRLNNNVTAPRKQFPLVQKTRLPDHSESSIDFSSPIHGSITLPRQHQPGDAPRCLSSRQTAIAALLAPEIAVRLQTDGAGKVSRCYGKSVLRPEITTTDFFAWFASQTGRGGGKGPPSLRFTFKDAMPAPTSSTIAQANEDHFNLMKKDLKTQFERAMEFVPNLKEFHVLVTDPGWVSEEEGW